MNKIFLIGLFLIILPVVFAADSCRLNSECTWYAAGNAATNNVTITIYDFNSNILYNNQEMTLLANDIYFFTSNISVEGQVVGKAFFYNSTGLQGTSEESKNIYTEQSEEELNMIAEILNPFLIFLIGAILLFIGLKTDERDGYIYHIFAGIWWMGSSGALFFIGTWITAIFFILLGFVTTFSGLSKLGSR
ncbi:hypothetical protein [Lutibacter sp.]|uniref:hypothetical protein n=1 Tax=Lutibacter sp. TaxID=1925666 RepID=UPI0034A0746F